MKLTDMLLVSLLLIPLWAGAQNNDWFQRGLNADDPKEQIDCFTKSIELEGDPAPAYFCRASAKLRITDVQGAIDDYTKCIEIDPNDAAAHYNRGIAKQYRSIDFQGAVADFIRAWELDSTNASYINIVSQLYMIREDYGNAVLFYNRVMKQYPANALVYDNLGYCYMALGNYSAALDNFRQAIALQPQQVDAVIGIALAFYYQNDLVDAETNFKKATELAPGLKQGAAGFESFKKDGLIYNKKDNAALLWMVETWR